MSVSLFQLATLNSRLMQSCTLIFGPQREHKQRSYKVGRARNSLLNFHICNYIILSLAACFMYQSTRLTYIHLGIPWHIIVYCILFKDCHGTWKRMNQVHVTVMEKQENQDSATNLAILKTSLKIFSKANPNVRVVQIRSDNAGSVYL